MSTIANVIPVVGLPTLTGWSQVVHSHIHQLVCVLAVSGPGAHNIGRDLVDVLTQAEPFDSVALHQLVLDLLAQTRKAEVQLNLVAILYGHNKLVMAACNGQVLYRKPTGLSKLLLNADAQPQLIEGKLISGATLVALTDQVASHTNSLLDQLNHAWETERLVTNLLPILHNQPDSALCALACITIPDLDGAISDSGDQAAAEGQANESQPQNLLQTAMRPLAHSRRFLANSKLKFVLPKFSSQKIGEFINQIKLNFGNLKNQPQFQNLIKRQAGSKNQKIRLLIGGSISLALIFLITGGLWFQNKTQLKNLAKLGVDLKPSQILIEQAKQQLNTDPISARDKTNQAISNLTALQQKYPKPTYLNKPIVQNLQEAQKFASEISGQSQLKDLNVFFDLRLAAPNFIANSIIISTDQAYFVDSELKQLIKLDLNKKQSQVINLTGLNKIIDTAWLNQQFYFLGDGISNLNPNGTETNPKNLKAAGDSDKDAILMEAYGSYLYLLNPVKRNIFRFSLLKTASQTTLQTLSEPVGWLIDKKGLDFGVLSSLAVDGDVWLSTKTGQILKYTQGQPIKWQITGLKTPFESNIILVTNEQLAQLYILESAKRRLVILSKTGQFLKELQSPTLAAVTSFGVSETSQKAFLVSGSTIYELGL